MTKKHFIALADKIKQHKPTTDANEVGQFCNPDTKAFADHYFHFFVLGMADFCASQNPNFNRSRWLGYINGTCGKNGGKVK